jgi:hypothetical protein
MSFFRNLAFASALVVCLCLPAGSAHACGPFFSAELFVDRAATLASLPDGAFLVEVKRLLPKPKDGFVVVESTEEPARAREGGGTEETALYQAGAAAWKKTDFGEAGRRFAQVLGLPAERRQRFSTFAAFMLGRNAGRVAEASRYFGQVRELAAAGFADPLGLAVASYGEEARWQLRAGNDREAIRLYAEQASHGSDNGALSLLFVSRQIVSNPERLQSVLKDPLAQRLLATYAWTRGHESWYEGNDERRPATGRLLDQMGALPSVEGAEHLAAAAWRSGRFELAARFADKQNTPLALWVQSKLALRRGDRASAEILLGKAIAGFLAEAGPVRLRTQFEGEEMPVATPRDLAARATGDAAVLALARGDFLGAMQKAAENCSYPDTAYLAEQVLTTQELAQFLQRGSDKLATACLAPIEGEVQGEPVVAKLRSLLARRLLRSGQLQPALAAFGQEPNAALARQYVEAQEKARSARDDIERAQALFVASQLARKHGMELLGTETGPDWAIAEGEYDLAEHVSSRRYFVQASEQTADRSEPPHDTPLPAELRATLLGTTEASRVSANAPPHAQRFHYRETAADLAEAAARLVPQRSQAYYALLCAAAKYVYFTNPKRMEQLWTEYVHHGALLLNQHSVFGDRCPEPELERARAMAAELRAWHWPKWRKRTWAAVSAPVLGVGVAIAALVLRRRKRRPPHAAPAGQS